MGNKFASSLVGAGVVGALGLCFALAPAYVVLAHADDPIGDVMLSSEYRSTLRGRSARLPLPEGVDPSSNYVKLFEGIGSKSPLFQALGEEAPEGFKIKNQKLRKVDELVTGLRTYTPLDSSRSELFVSLMVPHPALIDNVRRNLFFDYINLEPLPARTRSRSEITIDGDPATLYELNNDEGIVIMKLPQEARLVGRVHKYRDVGHLLKLLDGLNVGEIKRRLTS